MDGEENGQGAMAFDLVRTGNRSFRMRRFEDVRMFDFGFLFDFSC